MSWKHFLCLCVCSQNMCICVCVCVYICINEKEITFCFSKIYFTNTFHMNIPHSPFLWLHVWHVLSCPFRPSSTLSSCLCLGTGSNGPHQWAPLPSGIIQWGPPAWDQWGEGSKAGFCFFLTTTSLWGHWGVAESPAQVIVISTQLPLSGSSYIPSRASLVAQMVKNLPAMQETQVQSLGQEDPLEKEMATQSSILAWRIPWTEEPGRLQFMGSYELDSTGRLTLSGIIMQPYCYQFQHHPLWLVYFCKWFLLKNFQTPQYECPI